MNEGEDAVEIKLTQIEGYRFNIDFGFEGMRPMEGDEDPPLGKNLGPDPSRLLGAAVGQCLLSSLLFCMQKSRSEVRNLSAVAKVHFGRNEEKRLRVMKIDVGIKVDLPDSDVSKLERCSPLFEKFCTVSQSVMAGIPIDIKVERA